MQVAAIMTRDPITVQAEEPVTHAIRLMLQKRISGLPVVDATGKLAGIVTEGDFMRRTETGTERRRPRWLQFLTSSAELADEYIRSHGRKVGEIMTPDVATVTEDTLVEAAVDLMLQENVKRLPVIRSNHQVVGIVTRADLIRVLGGRLAAQRPVAPAPQADAELRDTILAEISKQDWIVREAIQVAVKRGVAHVTGVVTSDRERKAISVLVENVPGIVAVEDGLVLVEPRTGIVVDGPSH